ncbi:MAG TPA: integrin alpha, partial [Anaerolineae bacterium]|nr:integrin alpha [Anaerolineae bacterium]
MNARRTFAGVLVLPLLFGLSAIPGTPSVEAANQPPGSESAYGAVNADWWSTVQQDIRRSEYYITWQEQTYLADVPAAHQAPNRAHNLRTYFTPGGPVVIPRVWTEETDAPPWRWEVRLVAWGRDGALQSASPAALEVQENRIEYQRDGLVEWYRNDEDGLEQGFTLLAAPEGGQPGDALQLDLALGGDLVPELVQDGVELQLRAQGTDAGLRYSGLWAVDAIGESLPAWLEMQGSNLSIRIEDVGAAYPIEVAPIITGLPTSYDWATTFGQSGAEFATSVATAGDVDGDGYSEVIVGAPNYDSGLVDQGGVFVYYGSSGGLYEWSDWYKIGDQGGAHYGHSVATAGDVNGDGYADVIVGAPYYTNGTGQEGEGGTWVYHGSDEGLEDDWSTHDEGNQAGAAFGQSVGTAGDVNGDGYADVIVGAPLYNNGESEEGMVWVWHGSEGGLSNSHNWHAEANQAYASFGQSVSTAGDINRDGYADIIVGASRYTDGEYWEGAAFVWLGSAGGVNDGVDGTPANEHRHLQINQDSARFGWAVSTAGDVNGDGYADVI